jgi:penicillin-binding protein 1A
VALARRPQLERAVPDGVMRDRDDWIFAEFAETPELQGIDPEAGPQAAVGTETAAAPAEVPAGAPQPGPAPGET